MIACFKVLYVGGKLNRNFILRFADELYQLLTKPRDLRMDWSIQGDLPKNGVYPRLSGKATGNKCIQIQTGTSNAGSVNANPRVS